MILRRERNGTHGHQVETLTRELARVTAEYASYRKRTDRDRQTMNDVATINVLAGFLSILDDISLAEKNGDLDGTFKMVAGALRANTARLGLEQYGETGDIFNPELHDAVSYRGDTGAEYPDPVCVEICQPGYRVNTQIVRAARVIVAG